MNIMHKRILIGVAFLILAGLVWASNEPWKGKPYQQWNKADIEVILNNSPWCEKLVVPANWQRASGPNAMAESDANAELRNHMDTQKGGMPDTSPPDRSMNSAASTANAPPETDPLVLVAYRS
jgi:hypothetical protein